MLLAGLGTGAVVAGAGRAGGGRPGHRGRRPPRASATGPGTGDPSWVEVAVDPTTVVGRLPTRTMGLSFERATLATPLFSAGATALIALFELLGPGVLRLGGNSVERTAWSPTGAGLVPGVVAPADVDRLAAFAQAVGWPVLYGTPFISGAPSSVAAEAVVVAPALGSNLAGLELCNEPDLYVLDSTASPVAGTYSVVPGPLGGLRRRGDHGAPGIALTGPATCLLQNVTDWTQPFAADEGARLDLLTQHYYRGFGGLETIAELLADDPLFDSALPQVATAATGAGIGWRLAETNSFANGGAPGVSNTLASALWGVGLALRAAELGADGVNLHTSGAGAGYPPFVQVNGEITEIRPLFYGLLLVAAVGVGDDGRHSPERHRRRAVVLGRGPSRRVGGGGAGQRRGHRRRPVDHLARSHPAGPGLGAGRARPRRHHRRDLPGGDGRPGRLMGSGASDAAGGGGRRGPGPGQPVVGPAGGADPAGTDHHLDLDHDVDRRPGIDHPGPDLDLPNRHGDRHRRPGGGGRAHLHRLSRSLGQKSGTRLREPVDLGPLRSWTGCPPAPTRWRPTVSKFIMLIYGNQAIWDEVTPEDRNVIGAEYGAYTQGLIDSGAFLAGDPLYGVETAKTVSQGGVVTDGPFADVTEHLGGYYLVDVESIDAAVELAADLPGVRRGMDRIEVRPIMPFPPEAT